MEPKMRKRVREWLTLASLYCGKCQNGSKRDSSTTIRSIRLSRRKWGLLLNSTSRLLRPILQTTFKVWTRNDSNMLKSTPILLNTETKLFYPKTKLPSLNRSFGRKEETLTLSTSVQPAKSSTWQSKRKSLFLRCIQASSTWKNTKAEMKSKVVLKLKANAKATDFSTSPNSFVTGKTCLALTSKLLQLFHGAQCSLVSRWQAQQKPPLWVSTKRWAPQSWVKYLSELSQTNAKPRHPYRLSITYQTVSWSLLKDVHSVIQMSLRDWESTKWSVRMWWCSLMSLKIMTEK